MTEEATATASADTQGAQEGTADSGSSQSEPSPFEGMDQTLVEGLGKMGVTDVQSGLKALLDKQKFIDSSQRYPGSDDVEKQKDFFAKIAPENADVYSEPDLSKFDPNIPFDQDGFEAFKGSAHKYGLQPWQFDGMVQDLLPEIAGMGDRANAKISEEAETAKNALIEKYGGEQSEQFIELESKVNRVAEQVPSLVGMLSELGAITNDGRVTHPGAWEALAEIAGVMDVGSIATLETGSDKSSGDVGIDPETGKITDGEKATAFFKRDPEGYARMTGKA